MDELGRGTSTFDGYALAKSVLDYLLDHVNCLSMFTTHYRWLVHDYSDNSKKIGKYTMLIKSEGDGKSTEERVVFLYKFA